MTRFDEVARLKELEKKAKYDRVEHGAPFRACAARAAPWLLEVAACFQPGDAELIGEWLYQLEEEYGSDGESPNQPITRMLARLQKAAAIMEELE